MTESCPSPARSLALVALAGGLAVALWSLPLERPPLELADLAAWWDRVGTDTAVAAVLRLLATGLAAWVALSGLLGTIAGAQRSAAVIRLWAACTPAAVRRAVAVSAVGAVVTMPTISAPGAATAAEPAAPPVVLVDLGPAPPTEPGPAPVLVDLGPTRAEPVPDRPARATPPPGPAVDTWTVQAGDHLWHIAEETLIDRDRAADERSVRAYWARVIEANRAVIGDDIDLIHPGLVLQLPE